MIKIKPFAWMFEDSEHKEEKTEENTVVPSFDFGNLNETSDPVITKIPENSGISEIVRETNTVAPVTDKEDPTIINYIQKAFSEANLPGPDYFEFAQSLESMKNIIPDDAQRYNAAFAALAHAGLTLKKITDSASTYEKMLADILNEFIDASNKQKTMQIGNAQKERDDLLKRNEEIQKELRNNQAMISDLDSKISQAETSLSRKVTSFKSVCTKISTQISTHIENVKRYITNTNNK
jgi:predicted  nucleic acid-binding Zn-ribbon protein